MLWLWILLGCVAVPIVLFLFLLLLLRLFSTPDSAHTPFILKDGQLVKCWIVMARDELHRGLDPGGSATCHVVFTTDPDVPDLDERLGRIAKKLHTFDPGEDPTKDERITSQVMKSEIGYFRPLRLPKRLTGGLEAYNVSLRVYHDDLPHGKLTEPYIFCKVLLEGEHSGARVVQPPNGTLPDEVIFD